MKSSNRIPPRRSAARRFVEAQRFEERVPSPPSAQRSAFGLRRDPPPELPVVSVLRINLGPVFSTCA